MYFNKYIKYKIKYLNSLYGGAYDVNKENNQQNNQIQMNNQMNDQSTKPSNSPPPSLSGKLKDIFTDLHVQYTRILSKNPKNQSHAIELSAFLEYIFDQKFEDIVIHNSATSIPAVLKENFLLSTQYVIAKLSSDIIQYYHFEGKNEETSYPLHEGVVKVPNKRSYKIYTINLNSSGHFIEWYPIETSTTNTKKEVLDRIIKKALMHITYLSKKK
jgi:hypothetical protein